MNAGTISMQMNYASFVDDTKKWHFLSNIESDWKWYQNCIQYDRVLILQAANLRWSTIMILLKQCFQWNRWLINPLPLPPTYENKLQPYRLTNFSTPLKLSSLNFHLSFKGFIFFLSRVWFYEQINTAYIIQKHRKPTRDARSRHIISHVCSARGSLTAARISSSMRQ